jgi:23S rRNA G2445 N2-methylase RlmL
MHFINPMCGSGTLAIEAAMSGLGIEPAARIRNFGFMHIQGFDRKVYKEERLRLRSGRLEKLPCRIIASDHDSKALEAARLNAAAAGVEEHIEFVLADFSRTELPGGDGVIIINPPYGDRMGDKEILPETYTDIGTWFKHQAKGKKCFLFTGDARLAGKVGLKSESSRTFYNTTIECRLLEYDIY